MQILGARIRSRGGVTHRHVCLVGAIPAVGTGRYQAQGEWTLDEVPAPVSQSAATEML